MDAGRQDGFPHDNQTDRRVADGRPEGAGWISYGAAAERLIDNGYAPLPIVPGQKRPAPARWSAIALTPELIESWMRQFPDHGVGLRTGTLVGLDIDDLDPDRAHLAQRLAEDRFGGTLVRVGLWPKRLLLYRTEAPFAKIKTGKIEVLGLGQQFVAFGLHKGTARPYYWTTGETPLDIALADLPPIEREGAAAFLAEIPQDDAARKPTSRRTRRGGKLGEAGAGPVRDADGQVIDGRDAWLSQIAFHAVHDVLDTGEPPDAEDLAERAWARFAETTDLSRARQDGEAHYTMSDAARKVRDKLRLAEEGRLPPRGGEPPEAEYAVPLLTAEEGRERLNDLLSSFCADATAWSRRELERPPMCAIRATVGLGKSRAAREHLLELAGALSAAALPHRILVFTASHALAEETAAAWRDAGANVAVLRGYERTDPTTGAPMCRDLPLVRAALATRLPVAAHACGNLNGPRCVHFDGCLKQRNLRDVAAADVIVAPYDALYTGLAFEKDDVALLLIDEGFWARAIDRRSDVCVEDILNALASGMAGLGRGPMGAIADLLAFRQRLARALSSNGPGPLGRAALIGAGLSVEACRDAASLERRRLQDPGLVPGVNGAARSHALRIAAGNARILGLVAVWDAARRFLEGGKALSGRMLVREPDASGRRILDLCDLRRLHESLLHKPVLHLDATLRPELAQAILQGLEVETIDVAAPHMSVRLVQGSFGKSTICPRNGLAEDEAQRRRNRLAECVDYVRWHARRVAPEPVLVVTYQSIEAAFADIPNVAVAHFNAVAGLDRYKDVRLLISIGRPLPPSQELEALVGACFDHVPSGRYRKDRAGVLMRSGKARGIDVIRHEDEMAELLRAAICDDELIQVIGRGRGVNRTADTPLDVHVLADVALPLIADRLTRRETEKPDIFQSMLLAGIAVDSPADAAALHPGMFGSANEAKLAFKRGVFKGQNPSSNTYREMTLKSFAYRRAGRGRSWQRAWWIDGDAEFVRQRLAVALGPIAGWEAA